MRARHQKAREVMQAQNGASKVSKIPSMEGKARGLKSIVEETDLGRRTIAAVRWPRRA